MEETQGAPDVYYLTDKGLVSAVASIQNVPEVLFNPDEVQVEEEVAAEVTEEGQIIAVEEGDYIIEDIEEETSVNVSTTDIIMEQSPAIPSTSMATQLQEAAASSAAADDVVEVVPVKVEKAKAFYPSSYNDNVIKKPRVFKEDPYGDPPDPESAYSYRAFHCIRDVEAMIQRVQDEIGVKYVSCVRGRHFGVEDNWDITKNDREKPKSNYRIMFKSSSHQQSMSWTALPFIPNSGVPFVAVSHLVMCCEYMTPDRGGRLKGNKVIEYRKKVEAGEIIHTEPERPLEPRAPKKPKPQPNYEYFDNEDEDVNAAAFLLENLQSGDVSATGKSPKKKKKKKYKRKGGILPPGVQRYRETKKTGCAAALCVKQVARFPEYQLPMASLTKPARIRALNSDLREKLDKNEGFKYEMRYYVRIPNSWAHYGHEIHVENPKYISTTFREKMVSFMMHLKEKEVLSDIKFNVPEQKKAVKLHSAVLACSGSKVREYLINQDYGGLAEMLMPLNKASLDAFFKFVYSGHLEISPEVDLDTLESVFRGGGIKEGAQLCSDHKANPKPMKLNDWNLVNMSAPVTYTKPGPSTTEAQDPNASVAASLADHSGLVKKATPMSPFLALSKAHNHKHAHKIFNTITCLFNNANMIETCSRIEELLMQEKNSRDVMAKVMIERLDSHWSGEKLARPPPLCFNMGTCTEPLPVAPRQMSLPFIAQSPANVPGLAPGLSSLPFILVPNSTPPTPANIATPYQRTPARSPKPYNPQKGQVDLRNAIHVSPEDVKRKSSKIIDVKSLMQKLEEKEKVEAAQKDDQQFLQICIDTVRSFDHAQEAEDEGGHAQEAEDEGDHAQEAEDEGGHAQEAEDEGDHAQEAEDEGDHAQEMEDTGDHAQEAVDEEESPSKVQKEAAEERTEDIREAEDEIPEPIVEELDPSCDGEATTDRTQEATKSKPNVENVEGMTDILEDLLAGSSYKTQTSRQRHGDPRYVTKSTLKDPRYMTKSTLKNSRNVTKSKPAFVRHLGLLKTAIAKRDQLNAQKDKEIEKESEDDGEQMEMEAKSVEDSDTSEDERMVDEDEQDNSMVEKRKKKIEVKIEVTARKPEVKAKKPEVTAKKTEVQAKKTVVMAKKPEVKVKKTEVTAKKTEVTAKKPEVKAKKTEVTAKKTAQSAVAKKRKAVDLISDNSESGRKRKVSDWKEDSDGRPKRAVKKPNKLH